MDLLDKSLLNSIPANMSVELCLVCGDRASGRHYGAISCEGCKGFFKRSIRKQLGYQCRGSMNCEVTKHHRNRCQFCRLQKCLASGMRSDSVQHERKPIADKKELQISTTNTTSTSTVTATASTSANESGTEGITAAQNIFPVGFNFSDLQSFNKQRSLLTTGSYPTQLQTQQTQQQFLLTTNPYPQQDSFSFSSSTHTNEDDSMDNNSSCAHNSSLGNFGLTSENVATGLSITAAATAGFIQTSIDRNLINQSLDLVAAIQQQYINGVNNNNNNSRKMVSNRGGMRNRSNDNDNDLEMKDIKDVNCSNDCSGSHNNNNNNVKTTEGCYNDDEPDNDTVNIVKPELIIYDQGADSDDNPDDHFELPLVSKQNITFNIQAPSMVPSYLNTHYVCECGSRLLFLSVYWAKKIHTFQQLPEDIQISLLRRHWVELFAIGLPQCSQTLSISTILSTLVNNIIQLSELERVPAIKIRKLAEHAYMLNEFIQTFQSMNLDEYEYAYIRLIILFSPDNLNGKDNQSRIYIEKVQDYALKSLKMYLIENNHPASSDRCNKLLLRLMQLRALEPEFVEELFFSNLIGHIQVENMIPYILKLNDSEI